MAGESRYLAGIFSARVQALAFTRQQSETLLSLLADFADELATLEVIGLGSATATARRLALGEILDQLIADMAAVNTLGVALTIDEMAQIHAAATLGLLEANGAAELAVNFAPIGLATTATLVARPEISRAFRTIRQDGVADVDAILLRAALRGAPTTSTAMELRAYIVGADAYPPEILADRRTIGIKTLRRLGYEDPTPELVQEIRRETGKVAAKAQLIARTETMVAEWEAGRAFAEASPVVAFIQWFLSQRHTIEDICDDLAGLDWYGLGPGVYDPRQLPARPHPRCLCGRRHILRPVSEWGQPRGELTPLLLDPFEVGEANGRSPSATAQLAQAISLGAGAGPAAPPEVPLDTRIFRAWQRAIDSDAVDPLRDFVAEVGREMGGLDRVNHIRMGSTEADAMVSGGFFRGLVANRQTRARLGPGELHIGTPITLDLEAARRARRLPSTATLQGLDSTAFRNFHSMRTVIHEQNHALAWLQSHGEGQAFFDRATHRAMEEGLVEDRSRSIVARLWGIDPGFEFTELYEHHTLGRGSYADWVDAVRVFSEELRAEAFASDGATRAKIFGQAIRERHLEVFEQVRQLARSRLLKLEPGARALVEALVDEAEALFDPDGRLNDAFLVNEFFIGFEDPRTKGRLGAWRRLAGLDSEDARLFAEVPEAFKEWLGGLTESLGYEWQN